MVMGLLPMMALANLNLATNWHSFDIGKNNTVQFIQPNSSSVALNRVIGASASQIMGTLQANGQIFILNLINTARYKNEKTHQFQSDF